MLTKHYLAACAALSLYASILTAAEATEIFDTRNNCTGQNCGSILLNGTISGTGAINDPSLIPWTIQVFARQGECLRLDVIREQVDLVMGVIAPGGAYFFNDDKGGAPCPVCPRVVIGDTPTSGWYTVHVSNFFGQEGSVFTLRYGLYNRGNPNCGDAALVAETIPDAPVKPDEDGAGGQPLTSALHINRRLDARTGGFQDPPPLRLVQQERREACRRLPQVMTDNVDRSS